MTEILIYGIVGDSWDGLDAKTLVPKISDGSDELSVRINSPGGYVMEGLAILNALARAKAEGRKVTVHIDGLAASMASVIAMVGDEIVMADNALMMIHNPWDIAMGDAEELRRAADKLDTIRDQLVKIYAARTGLDTEALVAMLDAETWFTAEQALEQNFITSIAEAISAAACDISGFGFRKAPDHPHLAPSMAAVLRSVAGGARAGLSSAVAAALSLKPKETSMSEQGNKAADDKPAAITTQDVQNAAQAAVEAEIKRSSEIRALVDKHQLGSAFADELITGRVTIEDARAKVLDKLAERSDGLQIGHNAPAVVLKDSRDKWMEGAQAWLLTRAGVAPMVEKAAKARGETLKLDPGEFRGVSCVALATEALQRAGLTVRGRDPSLIVGDAFTVRSAITQTTSDFPILLENTMHKVVQAAYQTTPDTWSRFAATGSVSDFRDHNRYLLGTFGALDNLNEAGEYKNKPIPDGAREKIKATTKGNIINLSRQAIINDDLGVFSDLGRALGRAAKLTIEIDVYALLNSNPTMGDGVALFHASHGNLIASGSGTAPTVAAVDAMRVLMAQQKDLSGNEYLDIRPDVWVGPIGLGGAIRVVNGSQYDPDTANKLQRMNIALGVFRDLVDTPRLTGTAWYVFADKDVAPAIEVAFLNGVTEPFLDSEEGWRVDGTEWKVRLDYGVAAVNWRSAAKNAGA